MRRLFSPARVALLAGLSLVLAACGAAVTPTVAPTPIPPRAGPELLRTALANMSALQSFTWAMTSAVTYALPDYSYAPAFPETIDRAGGVADVTNGAYRFDATIHFYTQSYTTTYVARDGALYILHEDGRAEKLNSSVATVGGLPVTQGLWQPSPDLDFRAALSQGVTVTLGTPPHELVDGTPTTHLVMAGHALLSPLFGKPVTTATVEFWVDPQPPARVRRLVLTAIEPRTAETAPGLPAPDGSGVYFVVDADRLQLRRLPDGALVRTVPLAHEEIGLSFDRAVLAAGGESLIAPAGGGFYRWSTRDGHIESKFDRVNSLQPFTFSPDGSLLAVEHNGIHLYRTDDWQPFATLDPGLPGPFALALSPDNKWVAVLSAPAPAGGTRATRILQLWRSYGLREHTETLAVPVTGDAGTLLFTPDSRGLVIPSTTADALEVRQVPDGQLLATLAPGASDAATATISPDGRWLALAGAATGVQVWDLQHPAAAPLRLAQPPDRSMPGGTPHFSADGRWLVLHGRGLVVWPVPAFTQAPVYWPLQPTVTYRLVWHWAHFNEPVTIPPLRLAPTATPEP